MEAVPKSISVDGKKFKLSKQGTKSVVEKHKQDIVEFNAKERSRAGKDWRNVYQFRMKKFGDTYALYTS